MEQEIMKQESIQECPQKPMELQNAEVQTPGNQSKAPFHHLMLPISEQPQQPLVLDTTLLTDRKLRWDYLSRRFRAYHRKPIPVWSDTLKIATTPLQSDTDLWSGASSLEQALVNCCELPSTSTKNITSNQQGGSLARGYQVQFAGLLAKHCQSFKDRVLALAILERTLEQDIQEAKEEQESSQLAEQPTTDQNGREEHQSDPEDDHDEEWDPNNDSSNGRRTRRSTRLQRRVHKKNKNNDAKTTNTAAPATSNTAKDDCSDSDNNTSTDRMSLFLAAGGLRILKIWLIEATTPIYGKMIQGKASSKPSEFGLMLLPLLHLLAKIPFHKSLIVESKINKQIRKLSKLVDQLMDIYSKEAQGKEDLNNYRDPGVGGCVVVRVQETLNELKFTWEEEAKKSSTGDTSKEKYRDPFESMKEKLKERLKDIKEWEATNTPKPEWLVRGEDEQHTRERKRPIDEILPTSVIAAKKAAITQQKALKEREAEGAALKDKLKAVQQERRAHLERLKNQIKKRMQTTGSSSHITRPAKRKNGKSVQWKDGMSSDKQRNKQVLEEVFIIPALPTKETEQVNNASEHSELEEKTSLVETAEQKEPPMYNITLAEMEIDDADEENDDDDYDYDESYLL